MPPRPFQRFGERLRKLREQLRNPDGSFVTQTELARRCGWSRGDQWRYEDGRTRPGTERQLKLAEELGTTVKALNETRWRRRTAAAAGDDARS